MPPVLHIAHHGVLDITKEPLMGSFPGYVEGLSIILLSFRC